HIDQAIGNAREILGPAAADRSTEIAIMTADRSFSGFPWELAFDTDSKPMVYRAPAEARSLQETVTWVQSSLTALGSTVVIDGLLGPQTEYGLRALLPSSTLGVAHRLKEELRGRLAKSPTHRGKIFILRTGLEQERQLRRGHGQAGL